jgi:hypothetical protein
MATFVENDVFSEDLSNKIHDLNSDTFRWVLSNTAPVLGTTFLLSNITQISTSGGYTQMTDGAGGLSTTLSFSRTGQTTTVSHTTAVFTATGAVGPFRYIILVNDTPTSPLNPVIGWLDHGSSITMANTDTYTITNGAIFTVN